MGMVGIVGGGPAGLAAAMALSHAGQPFEIFEAGLALGDRRHDNASDIGIGIGGAGLFSDGKFSYYPSGSKLYEMADAGRLRRAYSAIADIVGRAGIRGAPFPDLDWTAPGPTDFTQKDYPSSYGTLDQRIQLVDHLVQDLDGQVSDRSRVERVEEGEDGYDLLVIDDERSRRWVRCDSLVLASGRFGAMALDAMTHGKVPLLEQRYEVGIRIEHPDTVGFLRHSTRPDVKFILHESDVEVRTFCTCRQGEVWMIPYDRMSALSGRSDGPPSHFCNFGLLPRFAGAKAALGREIWDHAQSNTPQSSAALWQTLPDFLDESGTSTSRPPMDDRPWHPRQSFVPGDIADALHPALRAIMRDSIRAIVAQFPDMNSPETVCLYPAIEGVGSFPDVDANLQVPGKPIWCCGDIVGRFRGLIPALVSGYYAGCALVETDTRDAAGIDVLGRRQLV